MSEYGWVSLLALGGWLILAGGAYASYRLNWRESVRMALIWAGIFTAAGLLFKVAVG